MALETVPCRGRKALFRGKEPGNPRTNRVSGLAVGEFISGEPNGELATQAGQGQDLLGFCSIVSVPLDATSRADAHSDAFWRWRVWRDCDQTNSPPHLSTRPLSPFYAPAQVRADNPERSRRLTRSRPHRGIPRADPGRRPRLENALARTHGARALGARLVEWLRKGAEKRVMTRAKPGGCQKSSPVMPMTWWPVG